MKRTQPLFVFLSILVLLTSFISPVAADAPTPELPPIPGAPAQTGQSLAPNGSQAAPLLNLPTLKAVIVVGEIDGPSGAWTLQEVANANLAKTVLEANGVQVTTFYPPIVSWDAVKTAAQGVQFFLYRGHGVSWGGTPMVVGGMYLGPNMFVSSDDIRTGLHLAPNAIVMLYACYSAGSSNSDAITLAEAQRRVAMYSDPFLDAGAGGYFSDWFGNAFQLYLGYLFQGMTQLQAYQAFYDYNAGLVNTSTHPDHPEFPMVLGWDDWSGIKYNNAFTGFPNATLQDLFSTQMVVNPSSASIISANTAPALPYAIGVSSSGSLPFSWTANLSIANGGNWVSLSNSTGVSGTSATVVFNPAGLKPGTYNASLRVVSTQAGVLQNDQTVPVTLVIPTQPRMIYLPAVRR